jgi:putative component of membrane protein insertase Oxa1/YidC/SpoIIIJ protein YidD
MNLLQTASLGLIDLYQREISPRKGFVCAHNALFRAGGCSGYAKAAIAKKGVVQGLQSLAQRFRECAVAASVVQTFRGTRGRRRIAARGIVAAAALSFAGMSAANGGSSTQLNATSSEYSDCATAQGCVDGCFGTDPKRRERGCLEYAAIEATTDTACCAASLFFC